MMKRFALALSALVLATIGFAAPAQATTEPAACSGATFTTHVKNRPDSAVSGGTWAFDTFTRTTAVTCTGTGYHVVLTDLGTFTTAGATTGKSPQAGTTLPGVVTGSFKGGTEFDVVSATTPKDPAAGADGSKSSSEWMTLVFPDGKAVQGAWSWTYVRSCGKQNVETWTNEPTSKGDIAGVPTCVRETPKPSPTSTSKPPVTKTSTPSSTVPAPSSTTAAPAPVVTYANCDAVRAAGKAPLLLGQTGYRPALDSDGDGIACEVHEGGAVTVADENLAFTGTSADPGLLIAGGSLILLAGLGLLFTLRRLRRR
jgi:hypothetical protein